MAADSLEASQSTPTCSSSKCACDNGKSVRSIPKGREGCINACIGKQYEDFCLHMRLGNSEDIRGIDKLQL